VLLFARIFVEHNLAPDPVVLTTLSDMAQETVNDTRVCPGTEANSKATPFGFGSAKSKEAQPQRTRPMHPQIATLEDNERLRIVMI